MRNDSYDILKLLFIAALIFAAIVFIYGNRDKIKTYLIGETNYAAKVMDDYNSHGREGRA